VISNVITKRKQISKKKARKQQKNKTRASFFLLSLEKEEHFNKEEKRAVE
jgi:hypothetical protein